MTDFEAALEGDKDGQDRIKQLLTSTPLSVVELLSVKKMGASLPFSWEQLLIREPTSKTWVDVDPSEVAEFKKWRKAFKKLRKEGYENRWYQDGGPDYGPEFTKPTGKWVYEYGGNE